MTHTNEVIEEYVYNLIPIFKLIKECEDGRKIETLLETSICHSDSTIKLKQ